MAEISDYTRRVIRQHQGRPKFTAELTALVGPLVASQKFLQAVPDAFDLDTAVGVQLDAVGLWVGRSRRVSVPLAGIYFAFDTPTLGLDQASWKGPFDPDVGAVELDDQSYRQLLRAKILLNNWDSSIEGAAAAVQALFGLSSGTIVSIFDNQDMTMTVGISGVVPPLVLLSLLQNGELPFHPFAVDFNVLITSVNTQPLFGFDADNTSIGGFDHGVWSGKPGVGPGQVLNFRLASTTANSATFSWQAPQVGTGPYTYQLQWRLAGGSVAWNNAGLPTNQLSGAISGLTSAQNYEAQVYAINPSGPGQPSAVLPFTTTAGVPAQVFNLHQGIITTTSIAIAWDAAGGADGYFVQYRDSGTTVWTTSNLITVTSYVASNLTPGKVYDFQVYAANQFGSGLPSNVLTIGTTGAAPSVPLNVQATNTTSTGFTATWDNPASNNGPYAFRVEYAQNAQPIVYTQFTGTITTSATGGNAIVTGLPESTPFLLRVTATNQGGSGPPSTPIQLTTLSGPPNQVQNVKQTNVTPTSVTLTWDAVTNATSYLVQYRQAGFLAWNNGPSVAVPTTTATVTGLTSGTTYQFRVIAVGA